MWYAITHFTAHTCWVFCGCECWKISCSSSNSGYTSIPAHLFVTWNYSFYYTYLLGILRPLILELKCLSSDSEYASIPTHLCVIWHYPLYYTMRLPTLLHIPVGYSAAVDTKYKLSILWFEVHLHFYCILLFECIEATMVVELYIFTFTHTYPSTNTYTRAHTHTHTHMSELELP